MCTQTQRGRVRGQRYPITYEGAKDTWKRARERAGVEDFRFHDIRHDVATKLLRATGNLKLVSKQLNHSSIQHTVKYAATSDEDLMAAMSQLAKLVEFLPDNLPD